MPHHSIRRHSNHIAGTTLLAPALLISACGPVDSIDCLESLSSPLIGACIVPEDGELPQVTDGQEIVITLTGEATEVSDDQVPEDCAGGLELGNTNAHQGWRRASDTAGKVWRFAASFPGRDWSFPADTAIDATFRYELGGFSPLIASFEARDEAGALQLWIADAGEISDLDPPDGLQIDEGDPVCTQHESCGSWTAYDLVAGIDGASVDVAYGTSQAVGDFEFVHGEYQQADEETSTCPDWYVAHVLVGLAP